MSATEVNTIRDGSQGYKTARRFNKTDTPWISNYEEMGRKTAIRRLCKYLPMSIELASAVALEGRAERNETQGLDQVIDGDFTVMAEDAPTDGGDEGEDQRALEHQDEQPMTTAAAKQREPEKVAAKAKQRAEAKPQPEPAHDPETGEIGDDAGLFQE